MAKTVHPPWNLSVPVDTEVADVPQDIEDLADTVAAALGQMVTTTAAATNYQTKIKVVVGTSTTALPSNAVDGTVYFLVAP